MPDTRQLSLLDLLDLLDGPRVEALLTPDQIYESKEFTLFSKLTEDDRFERKSRDVQPKDLARCLSAFGNGPSVLGACLALGVANNGDIEGCKDLPESRIQALEHVGSDHCPTGRFITRRVACQNRRGEDDFIILVRVKFVEDRLVELTDGTAWMRRGDKTKQLSETEKQEIRIDKGERAFELEPCSLDYPDDFHVDRVRAFCRHIRDDRGASEEHKDEQILESVRLGRRRDGKFFPFNACAILFAKDPQQVFPGLYIHFLRYSGSDEGSGREFNVMKDRMINGTLLDIIKDTAVLIDANLREFTVFRDGKFISRPEYPRDAWYELIVNACAHRSYHAKNAPIFVKMFDDRLEVESPGGFMPQVTAENIYEMHRPRNTFLMLTLREFGEVRCINEGTKRVRKEMQEADLPAPKFTQSVSGNVAVKAMLRNDIANRVNSLDSEAYQILGESLSISLDVEEKKSLIM